MQFVQTFSLDVRITEYLKNDEQCKDAVFVIKSLVVLKMDYIPFLYGPLQL